MNNVIHVDFGSDENCGYIMDGGRVNGVYSGLITAVRDDDDGGVVYIGTKAEDGIDNVTTATMDEINEFCLMGRLIFNPSVIPEKE